MKLIVLPDGRLIFAPTRDMSMDEVDRLAESFKEWRESDRKIALFNFPIVEVIDLRERKP